MRNCSYFEDLKKNMIMASQRNTKFSYLNSGEMYALRAYENAKELNVNMPIVLDLGCNSVLDMAKTFCNAHINKFIYTIPSTNSTDDIAILIINGYKIIDTVNIKVLLGEYAYKTCCEYGLIFGRK